MKSHPSSYEPPHILDHLCCKGQEPLNDFQSWAFEAIGMLDSDINDAVEDCQKRYPWFASLDPARQLVVASCAFNMGVFNFAEFRRTHAALAIHDWNAAAAELLDSRAARELPFRYARYAQTLRKGISPQLEVHANGHDRACQHESRVPQTGDRVGRRMLLR